MIQSKYLKYDTNNNGIVDNNIEERRNIELNAKQIMKIQNEINNLKRNHNIINSVNNHHEYASSAKIAEELTDGVQRIYFNNLNKSVIFKNNNTPSTSCIQINTKNNTIENLNAIQFSDNQYFHGLTDDFETTNGSMYAPSISAINTLIENYATLDDLEHNHDDEYAPKTHTHAISDITNLETTLSATQQQITVGLANKSNTNHNHDTSYAAINHNHDTSYAAINHNHDEKYTLLNNIVSEIQNIVSELDSLKIPNINAIRSYCSKYLTSNDIINNPQIQQGIQGKSAFDIWKEQQPPKQQGESNYSYNDFINAITGPQGIQGIQGIQGKSAYDIWIEQNNYDPTKKTYNDFLKDISAKDDNGKGFFDYLLDAGMTGASFVSSMYGDYSLQTQISALQAQITALEATVTGLLGGQTAQEFTSAMEAAKSITTSLSGFKQYLLNKLQRTWTQLKNIKLVIKGYTHI